MTAEEVAAATSDYVELASNDQLINALAACQSDDLVYHRIQKELDRRLNKYRQDHPK